MAKKKLSEFDKIHNRLLKKHDVADMPFNAKKRALIHELYVEAKKIASAKKAKSRKIKKRDS